MRQSWKDSGYKAESPFQNLPNNRHSMIIKFFWLRDAELGVTYLT